MVGCENGSGERSVQEVICESGEDAKKKRKEERKTKLGEE